MDFELSDILSSSSKTKVVEALSFQTEHVSLRHISYLTNLSVYSVEIALKQLLAEKIVERVKRKNKVIFSLNKKYFAYELLLIIFSEVKRFKIAQRAQVYSKRAPLVLNSIASMNRLIDSARKNA